MSQSLRTRHAWKLLLAHVPVFLAGSRVSSPSRLSDEAQVCLVCGSCVPGSALPVRLLPSGWLVAKVLYLLQRHFTAAER